MAVKVTKENILRKTHRQRKPVKTLVALASEMGAPVYHYGTKTATSGGFRRRVINELGKKTYKNIFA